MQIELKDIRAPRRNERDNKQLVQLIESIREVGLIEPIILNERKEIVSGRRRFFAVKELEYKKVPILFYTGKQVDQEIAELDANLMVLPLGDLEHDLALARRKKLYQEKYPDTKQHVSKGNNPSFTKDTSDRLNVSKRTIEKAVARVENASPALNTARKEGKISSSVAGHLARLPKDYQNKLIPKMEGKKVSEVKKIVDTALKRGVDKAQTLTRRMALEVSPDQIHKEQKRLNELLIRAIDNRLDKSEVAPLLKESQTLINTLQKFIEYYTAPKTILRKRQIEAQII